jgi:plasmid stabilization system protein ParE
MVIWSNEAQNDLIDILFALITWEKHKPLSLEEADAYIEDIRKKSDAICKKQFHSDTRYDAHKAYGEKVYRYDRYKHTQWYIIYDWDDVNKIAVINRIINNYMTIS